MSRRFFRLSGTSPLTMRWARPSTIAVLPTPGSPIRTGLFLVRRESTWRIRARFEQASERILSGADDADLPLPPPPAQQEAAPETPRVSTLPGVSDDMLDDFGEIDIKGDAKFSLDYEHGVSRPDADAPSPIADLVDAPTNHLLDTTDLAVQLSVIRSDAPERTAPQIDPNRHDKHRTRGLVTIPDAPMVAEPAVEEKAPEPVEEKPKKSRKERKAAESVVITQTAEPLKERYTHARVVEEDKGRRSRVGLLLIAIVLLGAAGTAGFFLFSPTSGDSTPPTTAAATTTTTRAPATPSEAAAIALDAFGFSNVQVGVDETGVATIVGTVRTARERDIAISTVSGVDGVVEVVTDITYDVNRDPGDVAEEVAAVELAVNHPVTISWSLGIATVVGIVPEAAVESGELGAGGTLEADLVEIIGVEEVRFELTLQGNPNRLRTQIVNLLTLTPIVYDEETGLRNIESGGTLDAIAELMAEEPGLTINIAVRGDDDTDEEIVLLAEQRRDEIVSYLTEAGVDGSLLQTVLVATMTEDTIALESDVLIEVVTP